MKKHQLWLALALFTIMLLALSASGGSAFADSNSPNDLTGISARFFIDAPPYNGNYTSTSIPLNVSTHYTTFARSEQIVIPYQSLGCVYQLDDGDWRNLTLYSSSSEVKPFLYGQGYFQQDVLCKYSTLLEIEQEGTHKVTVKLIPDELDSWFDDTISRNFTVYFNVRNLPSSSPTTEPSIPEFQSLIVLVVALLIAVIAAALFKSHKKWSASLFILVCRS
jgi:hypothetical protein